MHVGFIGLGNIGRPMAEQLAKAGHSLIVHDIREEVASPLLDQGARWAESPRVLAQQSEVICTCLPDPAAMERVTLGGDGILVGIEPESVYIDHTTNSPELVRRVHNLFREKGVHMLDAPVSGGMEGAYTRDLTMLVGGDQETFERCEPVLDAVAKVVMYVGEIGTGSICKIAHNCAVFCLDQAMAECLTLGVKAGVAPRVMLDAFRICAIGRNMSLHVRLPATLFRGDFEPRFALKLARKDIGLALELARSYGVPMRLAALCEEDMVTAMARGWEDKDSSVFLTLQEERAQVQLRLPEVEGE